MEFADLYKQVDDLKHDLEQAQSRLSNSDWSAKNKKAIIDIARMRYESDECPVPHLVSLEDYSYLIEGLTTCSGTNSNGQKYFVTAISIGNSTVKFNIIEDRDRDTWVYKAESIETYIDDSLEEKERKGLESFMAGGLIEHILEMYIDHEHGLIDQEQEPYKNFAMMKKYLIDNYAQNLLPLLLPR